MTTAVRSASPTTRVIALSSADDAATVRLMLAAGAVSYVVKGTPAAELLDMVLCRDVREPARAALARALVGFAHETGSVVIAEGIEEPDDLAALRDLGIELGQGFLLSRPQPADILLNA